MRDLILAKYDVPIGEQNLDSEALCDLVARAPWPIAALAWSKLLELGPDNNDLWYIMECAPSLYSEQAKVMLNRTP